MMIKNLNWDSNFFGIKIADISIDSEIPDWLEVLHFLKSNQIDLLQCLCSIEKTHVTNYLEKHNFHFVDSKIDFTYKLNQFKKTDIVPLNKAENNNFVEINAFAKEIFLYSRYFNDYFNQNISSEFYSIWLEKSIAANFDDICFVHRINNEISGFVTIKITENKSRIGLIGVNPKFKGCGVGTLLINYAKSYSASKDCEILHVATQACNIIAQNFYIRNDFLVESIKNWYYLKCKD